MASMRTSSPVAHVARREPLGGSGDPAQPPFVEREGGGVLGGARLHLDEGERAAPPGDDVDLAAGNAGAPGEDAPAVQPQIPAGERLGAAAALLGGLAVHLARSRARA